VRVLDLTRLLPGGLCTQMLADLGAAVIKIESTDGGDYARWMPPLVDGQGVYFHATNRAKQSAAINLKDARGQAVLHRLAASADVLVESYRPGTTARLGCDYATLKAVNPRLVYCAMSGWGQTGHYAQSSGHDLNYAAVAGLVSAAETPQPPGGQMADIGGAYAAVAAITAALFGRERTGEGAYLDIALFDAALPFVTTQWVAAVTGGDAGALTGQYACYNVYRAGDGEAVALAALEPKFWANFCNAIARPDLVDDYLLPERQRYLLAELAELFAQRPAAEWETLLGGADCCFTRAVPLDGLLTHPQVQARGLLGLANSIPWLRSPLRLNDDAPIMEAAPRFGQHTREILRAAGIPDDEIDALLSAGVIAEG
jgi:crotonobetainyl-CoA:carnitine CoA-transferase CaiB-like acyl-CoA transferase